MSPATAIDGRAMAQVPSKIPIAVRAYVMRQQAGKLHKQSFRREAGPSDFVLVFDTETTTDAAQALRFGTYHARENGELIEAGIFFEPEIITPAEQILIREYAETNDLNVLTRNGFVKNVFFKYGYFYLQFFCNTFGKRYPVTDNDNIDILRRAIKQNIAHETTYNISLQIMFGSRF